MAWGQNGTAEARVQGRRPGQRGVYLGQPPGPTAAHLGLLSQTPRPHWRCKKEPPRPCLPPAVGPPAFAVCAGDRNICCACCVWCAWRRRRECVTESSRSFMLVPLMRSMVMVRRGCPRRTAWACAPQLARLNQVPRLLHPQKVGARNNMRDIMRNVMKDMMRNAMRDIIFSFSRPGCTPSFRALTRFGAS